MKISKRTTAQDRNKKKTPFEAPFVKIRLIRTYKNLFLWGFCFLFKKLEYGFAEFL